MDDLTHGSAAVCRDGHQENRAAFAGDELAQRTGPQATRTFAKAERAATPLRDVNQCAVRPDDLIAHRGYTVLLTDTRGHIGSGMEVARRLRAQPRYRNPLLAAGVARR